MVISGAADSYGIYLAGRGSNTLTNNATVKVNRSSAYAEGKKRSPCMRKTAALTIPALWK